MSSSGALRVVRGLGIFLGSLCALLHFALVMPFHPAAKRRQALARWLHRWCGIGSRILGLQIETQGAMPSAGLLISNHLSYLDIIVLSTLHPCVFVAKSEVARWPLFGWLARAAGTIFVDRQRRADAGRVAAEMQRAIQDDLVVVLFPEGTSSGGSDVLPFGSALLEPAIQLGRPLTAAAISYSLGAGSVADEICYWRDMTFGPHLLHLLGLRGIAASLAFAPPQVATGNRKELARELHRTVSSLRVTALTSR